MVARLGLGANAPEDAIYPLLIADDGGAALSGDYDYLCHFAVDERPRRRRSIAAGTHRRSAGSGRPSRPISLRNVRHHLGDSAEGQRNAKVVAVEKGKGKR
jgi:hypothetical protein